ncbi:hypothetical protein MMC25_002240 [Agyrium rufum]|nr:hypothetical protein [Agyrium rufum]
MPSELPKNDPESSASANHRRYVPAHPLPHAQNQPQSPLHWQGASSNELSIPLDQAHAPGVVQFTLPPHWPGPHHLTTQEELDVAHWTNSAEIGDWHYDTESYNETSPVNPLLTYLKHDDGVVQSRHVPPPSTASYTFTKSVTFQDKNTHIEHQISDLITADTSPTGAPAIKLLKSVITSTPRITIASTPSPQSTQTKGQPCSRMAESHSSRTSAFSMPPQQLSRAGSGEEHSSRSTRRERIDEFEGTDIHRPMYRQDYIKTDDGEESDTQMLVTRDKDAREAAAGVIRGRGSTGHAIEGGLPVEKGYPIQIGSELFRLSGASIMSDAPSYFSKFFQDQLRKDEDGTSELRTLYIDRDPGTFRDICRHLQGYYVMPQNGTHYVRLFADAQFYSLPRLTSQLFESEIYIQIGGHDFRIPKEILNDPGNKSNYFTLGFGAFFAEPKEVFPGLDRTGLLRPPSIIPPSVPTRSSENFGDLLYLLRGYPLHIRNEEHRDALLADCRYFHFRGLEQQLVRHSISFNPTRQKSEIIMRLGDLKTTGISFKSDQDVPSNPPHSGWVNYARPVMDKPDKHELILEIGGDSMELDLRSMRLDFRNKEVKERISSFLQVIANRMNLKNTMPLGLMMAAGGASGHPKSPAFTPLSDDKVKIRMESDAFVSLDGQDYYPEISDQGTFVPPSTLTTDRSGSASPWPQHIGDPMAVQRPGIARTVSGGQQTIRKRKRAGSFEGDSGSWIIRRGQWRVRVQPRPDQTPSSPDQALEVVLWTVKLEALKGERSRNGQRGWLK